MDSARAKQRRFGQGPALSGVAGAMALAPHSAASRTGVALCGIGILARGWLGNRGERHDARQDVLMDCSGILAGINHVPASRV